MTIHNSTVYLTWDGAYRKIGGIHWLRFGRLRIAFCIARREGR